MKKPIAESWRPQAFDALECVVCKFCWSEHAHEEVSKEISLETAFTANHMEVCVVSVLQGSGVYVAMPL